MRHTEKDRDCQNRDALAPHEDEKWSPVRDCDE